MKELFQIFQTAIEDLTLLLRQTTIVITAQFLFTKRHGVTLREEKTRGTYPGEKSIGIFDFRCRNCEEVLRVGERWKNDHFLQVTDHRFPQFFEKTFQYGFLALIGEEGQSEQIE